MRRSPVPTLDRVYHDDATKLLATWRARCVDVVVSDPPYGNNVRYGAAGRRIAGDEHPLVGLQGIAATYRLLKNDSAAFVFCGARHLGFLQHFFLAYSQYRVREVLAWDKRQAGFGSTFRGAYESVLVLEKGRPRYRVRSLPTLLSVPRASATFHPHAKPVALLERLITASSDAGDIVLDPFVGSGSTGVAAANLGRRFVGVEIEPTYVGIARDRLAQALASASEPEQRAA